MADDSDDELANIDIGALLATTFEAEPSNEMADRIGARVALRTTVGELLRLVVASPWHWLGGGEESLDKEESE